MSNPLLRPNDPRFQKTDVHDAEGKNRFGESEQREEVAPSDIYAAAATDEARPFAPQYEVQQRSRATLLLWLGGLGWFAASLGAVSYTGLFDIGWVAPLLGLAPAAAAWFLAYEDLKAIRVGAIDEAALSPTRHAFWLGVSGLVACAAIIAAMIYHQMRFLPDV
jgi:hypothetical protein